MTVFMVRKTYHSVEEWIADIPNVGTDHYGGQSLAPYKILAMKGWKEGVEQIRKYNYDIDNIVGKRINEPAMNWDVTGVDFDMGTVLTGNPECWYDFHNPERKQVRVMYNPSARGDISAKSLALRGAMVAGLIDCLEKAGNRVELWMVYGDTNDFRLRCEVLVKPSDQPLDIDRVAFLCIHEASLRGLWFSLVHKLSPRSSMFKYIPTEEDKKEYDVVIERLNDEMSEVQIIGWIKEQLSKFGVEMSNNKFGD